MECRLILISVYFVNCFEKYATSPHLLLDGTLPSSTNHSLEADLVRIRIYRNEIYGHNHSIEITDADFKKLWEKISEALLRIAGGVSSAKRDEWKKSIESFFHDPLSPDAEKNVIQLRLWYRKEIETKRQSRRAGGRGEADKN